MSLDRQTRAFALGILALSAAGLGCSLTGCSSPIADMPSLGSADTSAKPKDPFLPVHDLPPDRDDAVITPDQRAKIEAELAAARDRQTQASAAQAPAAQATPTNATAANTSAGHGTAAQNTGAK